MSSGRTELGDIDTERKRVNRRGRCGELEARVLREEGRKQCVHAEWSGAESRSCREPLSASWPLPLHLHLGGRTARRPQPSDSPHQRTVVLGKNRRTAIKPRFSSLIAACLLFQSTLCDMEDRGGTSGPWLHWDLLSHESSSGLREYTLTR